MFCADKLLTRAQMIRGNQKVMLLVIHPVTGLAETFNIGTCAIKHVVGLELMLPGMPQSKDKISFLLQMTI